MFIEVDSNIRRTAQEIHRRRVLANQSGAKMRFDLTLAEVAALKAFELTPKLTDLKVAAKSIQTIPVDKNGKDVRIVYRDSWPMRVYSYRLDQADVFLFVSRVSDDVFDVAGWLELALVERAPIKTFEEDGEMIDYCHEIDRDFLNPLPSEFNFVNSCVFGSEAHAKKTNNAVWNYSVGGWECFGCSMLLYDEESREKFKSGEHNQKNKRTEGPVG